jgi:hypothetical protein
VGPCTLSSAFVRRVSVWETDGRGGVVPEWNARDLRNMGASPCLAVCYIVLYIVRFQVSKLLQHNDLRQIENLRWRARVQCR